MLFPIFAAIFSLQLLFCSAGDHCPPKSELGSCSCSRKQEKVSQFSPKFLFGSVKKADVYSYNTVIVCKSLRNPKVLRQDVISSLDNRFIDQLIIIDAPAAKVDTVVWLPSEMFQDAKLIHLEIRDTVLASDFTTNGDPFVGAGDYLIWFTAKKCSLSGTLTYETAGTVTTKGLDNLTNLEILDLSYNYLLAIDKAALAKLVKLNTLMLSKNSLQEIPAEAFKPLVQLTYVDLSHNLIKTIDAAAFDDPKTLTYFDISYNDVKAVADKFFDKMTGLKYLNVSNNQLTSLPQAQWEASLKVLDSFNAAGNSFKCDCDLKWFPAALRTGPKNQVVSGECLYFYSIRPMRTAIIPLATLTEREINCAT